MYVKKIQIRNYGPIDHIDITFPFDGENPKPVLLVGENGSGKSILLSHIVNGLMSSQEAVFPENSEVEKGKAYKLQSPSYIRPGSDHYWVGVNYESNLCYEEVALDRPKKDFGKEKPEGISGTGSFDLWKRMKPDQTTLFDSNVPRSGNQNQTVQDILNNNCILYFPHNRFEEPAWLNERNLKATAKYMSIIHTQGYTDRKIINYSSLHDNQNWLFEVLYDRAVFESTVVPINNLYTKGANETFHSAGNLPVLLGHQGLATTIYNVVLNVARKIFRAGKDVQFRIGRRQNRTVSLIVDGQTLVPNIFQLSSGETALLNLFLSILRDFDLSRAPFRKAEDVRGIIIVDEVDLHLHAIHQHDILPALIKLFPRVQFIVTTHSPLFVLGMEKVFRQDGLALYRLPQGEQISPEEFSEFGNAYESFTKTERFMDDLEKAVEDTQKPVLVVEGKTDVKYIENAAKLLDQQTLLERFQIMDVRGSGNLNNIWKSLTCGLARVVTQKVVLLYDWDEQKEDTKGHVYRRSISREPGHPVRKGIENLFSRSTLENAKKDNIAFTDTVGEHDDFIDGQHKTVPEQWFVTSAKKTNLCDWLCENGTKDDFGHFELIFDLLEKILADGNEVVSATNPEPANTDKMSPTQAK